MKTLLVALTAISFSFVPLVSLGQGHLPQPCAESATPPPAHFQCPSPYVEMDPIGSDEIFDRVWHCHETGHTLGQAGGGCGGSKGLGMFPNWSLPAKSASAAPATSDYRSEIITHVVHPCFKIAVQKLNIASAEESEATAWLEMDMKTDDVDAMVNALLPVAKSTADLQARQRMYVRAKVETCVEAMTTADQNRQGTASKAGMINSVTIESDAILGSELKKMQNLQELLDELVDMTRAKGWKCDSIASARKLFFSRGFSVSCNRYAYKYLIKGHCHVNRVGPQRPAWIPFQAAALALSHTLNASFRNRLNVNLLRKCRWT